MVVECLRKLSLGNPHVEEHSFSFSLARKSKLIALFNYQISGVVSLCFMAVFPPHGVFPSIHISNDVLIASYRRYKPDKLG